jgi:nitrite reductase/ring-hydroxylating ferredoxin subunit/DMSO/TMAO reductase YedYZ heme-binding membrane subunit
VSVQYSAVKWNRNKRVYDLVLVVGIVLYLAVFIGVGKLVWTDNTAISDEVLLIRAFGTCAILLLHIVLCIGPLARFDRRFLPVLYNRRHLGVATFCVGLGHGILAIGYYHGFGKLNPLVSLLTANTNYGSWTAFPFETLGLVALGILFLMAATSHDFWQKNLSASFWKSLHMLVYPAYVLLILHVALGALQAEASFVYSVLVGVGAVTVVGLHLVAGFREQRREITAKPLQVSGAMWIDVGSVDDIPNNRAKTVCLPGRERIAVFRYDGKVSAVTNVCAHQRGPLGEGKVIDGCISCPWHGWEYRPHNGQSPPPFTEKIATFRVRVESRRVLLNPEPLSPGTPVEPASVDQEPIHERTQSTGVPSCHVQR